MSKGIGEDWWYSGEGEISKRLAKVEAKETQSIQTTNSKLGDCVIDEGWKSACMV